MLKLSLKDRETEYLLIMIRCAVTGEALPEPDADMSWDKLISLANRQQAYSLIAPVIDKSRLSEANCSRLEKFLNSELIRMIAVKSELELLSEELEEKGVRYMLLKGSLLRALYPKESMRQMSDVDILYDQSGRESLLEIMRENGYSLEAWSDNSDDFFKKPYYSFEFHRQLFFNDFGFTPDFSFVWENALPDGNSKCRLKMSDNDLYLHSVAHMYKHYILGGFGVRFLSDTYLMLKKLELDKEYIDKKLEEMELTAFEKEVRALSLAMFEGDGFTDSQIEFFNKYMSFGIFGSGIHGKELLFKKFQEEHNSDSLILYALSRFFPKKEFMVRTYPVLKKKPWLLGFYYLKRVICKTFTSFGKSRDEIKTVKKIKKQSKNTDLGE